MNARQRLERLERLEPSEVIHRSPKHVYDRIRREAMESIEESLKEGEEPRYRIAENGDVLAASDGRTINHYGDFIRVLDEDIARLDREIAELEAEEETDKEGAKHG
jgi:flagellar biosynthesis chaperone FliJ